MVKLDDTGTLLWQKALGGSSDDGANSIAQTTDGGYIVAGYSSSTDGDVSGNHGQWDYWVVKLDASGNLTWQKSLGGSSNDMAYAVKQSSDGGYIVTGYSESSDGDVSGNTGARDFWIVKLNEIGDLEWENYFGGSAYDESYAVAETAAGDFVASGFAGSNDGDVSGNHGGYDFWIVKIDAIGNLVSQACFGGSNTDQSFSMDQTADGGFVIGGQSLSNDGDVSDNHGGYDFWLVKLDSAFNIEWQKTLGGTGDEYGPYCAQQTAEGGFVVTGSSLSNDGDVTNNHGGPVYGDCWDVKLIGGKATGTEDIQVPQFSIFPNPVIDQLYVEAIQPNKMSLSVYDLQGRLMSTEVFQHESQPHIAVNSLISGTYLLEMKNEETGLAQRQKFVKQ